MQDRISFEQGIIRQIIETLISDYQSIVSYAVVVILSILLFSIGLSLVIRVKSVDRAYISRNATSFVFHYIFVVITILMIIYRLYRIKSGAPVYLSVLSGLVGCVLVLFLCKLKAIYAYVLPVFCIAFFVCDLMWRVSEIAYDYSVAMSDPVPRGLFYYGWDSYLVSGLLVEGILLSVLFLCSKKYYLDRRYLFDNVREGMLKDARSCPKCDAIHIKGSKFCYCCGESLDNSNGYVLEIDHFLDRISYCPKCGAEWDGKNACNRCSGDSSRSKSIVEGVAYGSAKDAFGSLKKRFVIGIMIAVILTPAIKNETLKELHDDAEDVHNNYVAVIDMAYDDFSVTSNPEWIAEFDLRAEELNSVNSRIFSVNLDKIGFNDLYYYSNYSKAIYLKMWSMSILSDSVHNRDQTDFFMYVPYFNQAVDLEIDAAKSSIIYAASRERLDFISTILPDAFRYYTSFLDKKVFAIAMGILSVIMLTVGIVIRFRNPLKEYAFSNISYTSDEEKQDVTKRIAYYKSKKRGQIAIIVLSIGVLSAFFVLRYVLTYSIERELQGSYEWLVTKAFIEDAIDLTIVLNEAKSDRLSDDEYETVLSDIDGAINSLDEIEERTLTSDKRSDIKKEIDAIVYEMKNTLQEIRVLVNEKDFGESYFSLIGRYNDQVAVSLELCKRLITSQTISTLYELMDVE